MSTVLREGATMWSIFFFFLQRKFSKAGWGGEGVEEVGLSLSLFSQSIFLIMPMTHLHIGRGEDAGGGGGVLDRRMRHTRQVRVPRANS